MNAFTKSLLTSSAALAGLCGLAQAGAPDCRDGACRVNACVDGRCDAASCGPNGCATGECGPNGCAVGECGPNGCPTIECGPNGCAVGAYGVAGGGAVRGYAPRRFDPRQDASRVRPADPRFAGARPATIAAGMDDFGVDPTAYGTRTSFAPAGGYRPQARTGYPQARTGYGADGRFGVAPAADPCADGRCDVRPPAAPIAPRQPTYDARW